MNNIWKTSVTEIFLIFKGALSAIIPWLEKAKIKWKEEDAYDDWDNIAEALYMNIVCSSLTGDVASEYNIARYNFNYDDYASIDYIAVKSRESVNKKFAFIAFQSKYSPLDSVKVAELNREDKVVGVTNLNLVDLIFVFMKNKNGHNRETIDNIEIEL